MKPYYEQDGITLYHGDCREVLDWMRLGMFSGPCPSAVISDPPYGIAGSSGTQNLARGKSDYKCSWEDSPEAVATIFAPAIAHALTLSSHRGVITPGVPNCFKYPEPDDMGAILQPASVGMSKWGACTWQPVLFYGRDPYVGKRILPTTFTQTRRAPDVAHPCTKPDGIAQWMIERGSIPGECILDPFAGAGSFLVAAKLMGRRGIGIEIEERFCEVIAMRLSQSVLFGVDACSLPAKCL